jgi:hypothetical protein
MKLIDIINNRNLLDGKSKEEYIQIECDGCSRINAKKIEDIKRHAKRSKTGKSYCSKVCQNNSQVTVIEVSCDNCGISFKRNPSQFKKSASGKKFCSHKCRAVSMNWEVLAKDRTCKGCKKIYKQPPNSGRTNEYCVDCTDSGLGLKKGYEDRSVKHLTIKQFADKINNEVKSKRVRAEIAKKCRDWNRHLDGTPCQVCGYDKIVEFCHIKPVKDFTENDTLGTINDESNIFMLCPRCHAEFDRGWIEAKNVPARKQLTEAAEIEYHI